MNDDTTRDDESWDEAESTRYFLAQLRGQAYTETTTFTADAFTPLDEYKGNR